MQSGLCSPEGDAEAVGHLRERQADVVMEHEHRPLFEGEPPEGSVDLVAVVNDGDLC